MSRIVEYRKPANLSDRIERGERITAVTVRRHRRREGRPRFTGRVALRLRPVARMLMLGKTNREISQELGSSQQTVKNYVKELLDAVGADDRQQVVHVILQKAELLHEIYETGGKP